jgi:hypothetical protein
MLMLLSSKETFMTISLRSARLILAAACVCFALGLSPFAHSQAAPAAAQQRKDAQPVPLKLADNYEFFIEAVGTEDARIREETKEGKTHIVPRRDYATEAGISKDEEQVILAILIDAFQRGLSMDRQHDQEISELYNNFDQSDRDEVSKTARESDIALQKTRLAMLKATVGQLKSQLGEETFAKLNDYLKSGKLHSFSNGLWENIEDRSDPCPANNNPPPGQTTHLACANLYRNDVFMYIGRINEGNRRIAAESDSADAKPERFILFDDLPKDRREAAFALGVEANRVISEIDEKARTEAGDYFSQNAAKYGLKIANQMPESTEVQALEKKSATTLEEYILKLRQVVGDDFFNNLDTYLSKENKLKNPPLVREGVQQ